MIKRLTWFLGGAVAGAAGAGYAKRKVRATAVQLAPANVARTVTAKVRGRARDAVEAVREGKAAMQAKEAELQAKRSGDATVLADALDDGDQVIVDGLPVEPGQVIVLHQVQTGPRRHSRRVRRGA